MPFRHRAKSSDKARGATIGKGTHVRGALVAEQNLYVARGCTVKGPVLTERDIFIDTGATIGTADPPTTVTGSSIYVAPGVISHGTVWARRLGLVIRMEA